MSAACPSVMPESRASICTVRARTWVSWEEQDGGITGVRNLTHSEFRVTAEVQEITVCEHTPFRSPVVPEVYTMVARL